MYDGTTTHKLCYEDMQRWRVSRLSQKSRVRTLSVFKHLAAIPHSPVRLIHAARACFTCRLSDLFSRRNARVY